jgi:ABC-2 type transport system ATP-binding protein/lipopolysaccharide transport system ATP-binding protein
MLPRISLKGVSVEFPIFDANTKSLRHALFINRVKAVKRAFTEGQVGGSVGQNNRGQTIVRALSNIDLELQGGDRIGLVGHNGSGKTTLLRILSGIFEPTAGTISISGTPMPLFNITEGMDPDATGMELIRVRGYLLGLTSAEIAGITDDVIQFCELGEFIDLPIRTYSSGMFVRLAFAITTAVTSDILLMDEVIGAGDAAFIERAELRLRGFVERSGILVVASHSPEIIKRWCNKALLLEHGRMVMLDKVESVLDCYQSLVECRRE